MSELALAPEEPAGGIEADATAQDTGTAASDVPISLPEAKSKSLEELKDEAGAWTLASDESV